MNEKLLIRRSLSAGRRQARAVLAFRNGARASRRAAVGVTGVVVAEGDSWFDYPLHDVLRVLEDRYGYDVRSVAHLGDRIEAMAYDEGQLEEFTRLLEKLFAQGVVPQAILLSGGGNDIAGEEFGMLLNHAASQIAGWNEDILRGVVDVRLRGAFVSMIEAVSVLARNRTGKTIPIVLHGYDYAVPDGRGFLGGWGPLPGPWLQPGFREKGYPNDDLATRKRLLVTLIDRFNRMVATLPSTFAPPAYDVRYVDLRRTLSNGADYRQWWDNELHPTPRGWESVAAKIEAAIRLPAPSAAKGKGFTGRKKSASRGGAKRKRR